MRALVAIAVNTFREAIRDRILYGFLFFAVALILFSLVLGQLALGDQVRVVLDVGLAGVSLFAVLMAIFLGISLLHKEIEKRTIYPLLSKPVSRPTYVVGKYLGLVATMLAQIALMALALVAVLFTQHAAPTTGLLMALALIAIETMVILALALFFTSFSSPFLSGIFCLGLFAAGRNAALIGELAARDSLSFLAPVLAGVTRVVPNLHLFYPSGKMVESSWATVHGQFISSGYFASTVGYGLAYAAVFVTLAALLLNRRDFV